MLGFERKEPFVIRSKYAEELLAMLERMCTGNYNDEELERFHDEQVSPAWELINGDNPDAISNVCDVCDLHRNGACEGKHHSCESYMNAYDSETCRYCKHAQPIEDDERHIMCPIKGEQKNVMRWCNRFEKK